MTQDMIDAYTSTIIGWFENRVNNIGLKIPLPQGGATAATVESNGRYDSSRTTIVSNV